MIIKPKSQVSNVRKFAPSLAPKKPILKLKETIIIEETNNAIEVIPKSNNNLLSLILENSNNDTSISIDEKRGDDIHKDNIDNNDIHKNLISYSPKQNNNNNNNNNVKKTFISRPQTSSSSSSSSVINSAVPIIRCTRSKTDILAIKPNLFENSINIILEANSILENKPRFKAIDNSMEEESSDSENDIDIFNNYNNKKKIVKSKQKIVKNKVSLDNKPKKEKKISKSKQKALDKIEKKSLMEAKLNKISVLPPSFGINTQYNSYVVYIKKRPEGIGIRLKVIDEHIVVRGFHGDGDSNNSSNQKVQVNDVLISVNHIKSNGKESHNKLLLAMRWNPISTGQDKALISQALVEEIVCLKLARPIFPQNDIIN